jgi:hypothetical protein
MLAPVLLCVLALAYIAVPVLPVTREGGRSMTEWSAYVNELPVSRRLRLIAALGTGLSESRHLAQLLERNSDVEVVRQCLDLALGAFSEARQAVGP